MNCRLAYCPGENASGLAGFRRIRRMSWDSASIASTVAFRMRAGWVTISSGSGISIVQSSLSTLVQANTYSPSPGLVILAWRPVSWTLPALTLQRQVPQRPAVQL